MWETTELGSEDLLWATTNFVGGIAGQREGVCGAVSGAAVYLGLKHRCPLHNAEQAGKARMLAREQTRNLVLEFSREHGDIICGKLLGIDFSNPEAVQQFRDSGKWIQKCSGYVNFIITELYKLENSK